MQKIIPGVACHTVETLVFLLPLVPPWTFTRYIPVAIWLDKICRLQFCVQVTNDVLRIILCGNSATEQAETLWRNSLSWREKSLCCALISLLIHPSSHLVYLHKPSPPVTYSEKIKLFWSSHTCPPVPQLVIPSFGSTDLDPWQKL